MHHSITFGDKNTWDDWGLVSEDCPVFSPPPQKRKLLEIEGADGAIDLSTAITGYPVFENRTGSLEFVLLDGAGAGYPAWAKAYSDIMDYLHGQTMRAVLEDDQGYYYEGHFSVNDLKSNGALLRIVIDYDVGPYKWSVLTSAEPWLWDPFNFYSGVIQPAIFAGIEVTTTERAHTFTRQQFGRAPVCPVFTATVPMQVQFVNTALGINSTKNLTAGTTTVSEWVLYGDAVTMYFQATSEAGTVSIDFRSGRL